MIFDTDIFIWVQRGHRKAASLIDRSTERYLSVYSYLELLQSAQNKQQHHYIHDFLSSLGFVALPLTENIGHRALIYIEQYALSHGLRSGDAIIAATAAENNLTLVSSNAKHFKPIKELKFKVFKP
ncbi:MAG: type II toxin-antitoxin system VapC family toxin [Desulfobacteraceae bacterium]|nr:type II toxin-antitoxin system VapC family toxin [Desulfobacteraceae bacterium]